MSDIELHIMIIDDNVAIHEDFIKVLSTSEPHNTLNQLEEALFGESSHPMKRSEKDYYLPAFIFETASQGKEGVRKIKEGLKKGIHYALAFVDVRMPPGWDGIETIRHMWEIDPDIQVVICTAYSDYTWEETVQKLGMGDNYLILKKPFDSVAVRQLACALTKKWLLAKDAKHHMALLEEMVDEKTDSLQQSLALLRSTIESTIDGIFVIDLNNHIIDFNENFLNFFGLPKQIMKTGDGELVLDYVSSQVVKSKGNEKIMELLAQHVEKTTHQMMTLKNGKTIEAYTQPHRMGGQIIGQLWNFRDITERANLEKKLEYQASHDILTGLPNRILLVDRIQHSIKMADRHKYRLAVLFFDLDRFKLVNDSLTHDVGDELLRLVAKRLSGLVRKGDTLARLGGDEFIMVIPELEKEANIISFANKIISAFKEPFKVAHRELMVTTSIGISIYPDDGHAVNKLLKNADLAMYQAKEQGGNQVQFYSSHLNREINKRFRLESELRAALEREEFELFYQPQFDVKEKTLLSVEALLRWHHPTKGLLLPLDFIPVAEESGLIVSIGLWVIKIVCQKIQSWKKEGYPLVPVAVNVATAQLRQLNFAKQVKELLDTYEVEPSFLEIEITENVIITHPDVFRMIHELKAIGVKIVLDDFGTGNSSLNYLKNVHIDRLKIDQSFVQNIATSRSDEVIIRAIIAMARSLNFKVVAEGVESKKQIDFLKTESCDEVQGFLLSKPLSEDAFKTYMRKSI